jgi:PAS domain S-box-containing protein
MNNTYRTILEDVLAGFWDWNIAADTEYLSPTFKATLGYRDDEFENSTVNRRRLVHPDDLQILDDALAAHINSQGKVPYDIELRYIHKKGSIVWVKCTGKVIEWDNLKPVRMVGCHANITTQRNLDERLKETESLLYQTNLTARVGGWEVDLVNSNVKWTKSMRHIFDLPLDYDPHIDNVINFFKRGPNRTELVKAIKRAKDQGVSYDLELIIVTAAGRELWTRAIGHAVFNQDVCVKMFGTLQDIDEQRKVRDELRISEERFRGAFEYSAIGMTITSIEGKWLKVNKKLSELFGYTMDELITKSFQELTYPDDLQANLELFNKLIAGDIETYQMEKRFIHKTGRLIWALISVSLVKTIAGTPLHLVTQYEDITERKRATDVIREQNSRLLNFAHIVSHNLRSHSGNIMMLTDLINEPLTDDTDRPLLLKHLQTVSTELSNTIGHLNEVVSIQTNVDLYKADLNLYEYINKTIDLLSTDILNSKIDIINYVDENCYVNFNPAYLESILLNLITNSIKYRTKEIQAQILIECINLSNSRKLLTIADNGIGIDMEKYGDKLFGMYKTFHGNADARGIGLFITKNQVEAMGGKIAVESEVGKGTTFKIYLI